MVISENEFRKVEERLQSLEETLEVLADKRLLSSIKKSVDDIKHGRYGDYSNVRNFRAKFQSKA